MSINNDVPPATPLLTMTCRPKSIQFPWHSASAAPRERLPSDGFIESAQQHPAYAHSFSKRASDKTLASLGNNQRVKAVPERFKSTATDVPEVA